jgi:hypothetical protein
MKRNNILNYLGAFAMLLAVSSCEDDLNINDNPNSATDADVQLVLPQAIVSSASIANQYNSYGAHFGGMIANAGGFSGFGNLLNYNLTPTDYNGLWVNTYQDPLADLKYVIDKTEGQGELAYYNAAAKIMSVVNYQRLVDAFGDVPYSEALQAETGITAPAYDQAEDIYRDLYAKLDQAIATIETAANPATLPRPLRLTKANDPLFGSTTTSERAIDEQMADWIKYANTLKLRILIRVSEVPGFESFVTTGFASLAGKSFLTDDAIVDPGYELNRPNPEWATWGRTPALALANSSRIPTKYVVGFYNGTKISDTERGNASFVNFPGTPSNQLGNENGAPTVVSNTVTWAANAEGYEGLGILKGAGMGQPLMLAAESWFLQSEAQVRDLLAGGDAAAKVSFEKGIRASFAYLWKDENEAMSDTTGLFDDYLAANVGNPLVDFDAALTDEEKIEAIITQKYIALNMINADEAWNEYRRTGYPATSPGNANPALDIASNKSNVTSRPDRLPTRIMYPSSEQSYNAANYRAVDYTSELIFWDLN